MSEKRIIQFLILIHWTLFYLTTVMDKIIPDVYPLWVGADFYTLFIKFFASLGITNPLLASMALSVVSGMEVIAFVSFLFSLLNLVTSKLKLCELWFFRGIGISVIIFSIFSIGDQFFGDRFSLLEHGIFWIILVVSWVVFKFSNFSNDNVITFKSFSNFKKGVFASLFITAIITFSLFSFSSETFSNKSNPVHGVEVVEDVFKFDLPFLADKNTLENTLKSFSQNHPNLKINYIYTGPDELNSKKKTHLLLYIFTEKKSKN